MSKKYKIILSAYACEPDKGSEPGVGWNFALEIANRKHEVWVLTRSNNKKTIDLYFESYLKPINLHFIYYDLPMWVMKYKKLFGVQMYYFLWQLFSLNIAKKHHQIIGFDLAHHITFGVLRHPNLLYRLKVPLFIGPIGGGEYMPDCFLNSLLLKSYLKEFLRKVSNKLAFANPVIRNTYSNANLIFCTTKDTAKVFPQRYAVRIRVEQAIGTTAVSEVNRDFQNKNLLYIGRLEDWKGVHLLIQAYNKAYSESTNMGKLTIVGSQGNYKKEIKKLIYNTSNDNILWKNNWIKDYSDVLRFYTENGVFIFLSLHEAGGMVVIEALMRGLPVICFDIGGPGQIIDDSCGRVINTYNKTKVEIERSVIDAIKDLQGNSELRLQLSKGALKRASEFTWQKTVDRVYTKIETYMESEFS